MEGRGGGEVVLRAGLARMGLILRVRRPEVVNAGVIDRISADLPQAPNPAPEARGRISLADPVRAVVNVVEVFLATLAVVRAGGAAAPLPRAFSLRSTQTKTAR